MTEVRIVGLNKVIKQSETQGSFLLRLREFINEISSLKPDLIVLPEYCWGNKLVDKTVILDEISSWGSHPALALGTGLIKERGRILNSLILINSDNELYVIPKRNPMLHERKEHQAENSERPIAENIVKINGFKFGFLVCADMWQSDLVRSLVVNGVDVLICPAMTSTLAGLESYAKVQWQSLVLSRAKEFVVPIVVVDFPSRDKLITGSATFAVNPSLKDKNLQKLDDFLILPDKEPLLLAKFDLAKIEVYREYRKENGLYNI